MVAIPYGTVGPLQGPFFRSGGFWSGALGGQAPEGPAARECRRPARSGRDLTQGAESGADGADAFILDDIDHLLAAIDENRSVEERAGIAVQRRAGVGAEARGANARNSVVQRTSARASLHAFR